MVIVVGPERPAAFARHFERHRLPFVGLPDPGQTVLRAYGQEFKLLRLGRLPAQAIVDREGIVRYVHYGHSMSDIPSNEEVLQILSSLRAGGV